jgi:SAM-dependent methyltransferase
MGRAAGAAPELLTAQPAARGREVVEPPTSVRSQRTRDAYEALAIAYDALTADYCYERWLSAIAGLLDEFHAQGHRLLDLACGTGKSFVPMFERGYTVTACDVSPAMASLAARKAPTARIFVADMCTLGRCGALDVVTCLDDALNYLLDEDELAGALRTVRANLAPGGLAVWDVSSLLMYRTSFATDLVLERDGFFIAWSGAAPRDVEPSAIVGATIDVFAPQPAAWSRARGVHRQRHWPPGEVERIAQESGLGIVAVRGQRRGALLDRFVDEDLHSKILFVACRDDDHRESERRCRMIGSP